jgi:hypothetical protein
MPLRWAATDEECAETWEPVTAGQSTTLDPTRCRLVTSVRREQR